MHLHVDWQTESDFRFIFEQIVWLDLKKPAALIFCRARHDISHSEFILTKYFFLKIKITYNLTILAYRIYPKWAIPKGLSWHKLCELYDSYDSKKPTIRIKKSAPDRISSNLVSLSKIKGIHSDPHGINFKWISLVMYITVQFQIINPFISNVTMLQCTMQRFILGQS